MNENNFSEIYNLLYVGLLGCNNKIKNTLDEYYKSNTDFANPTFFFYEYLLNKPLPFNKERNKSNDYFLLAPFIQRLANKNPYGFNPLYLEKQNIIALKEKDLALSKIIINVEHSVYSNDLISYWLNNKKQKTKQNIEGTTLILNNLKAQNYFYGFVKNYKKSSIINYIKKAKVIKEDECSKKSILIEGGFVKSLISAFPRDGKIPAFVLPIASNQFFYGEILFWFPSVIDFIDTKNNNKLDKLLSQLFNIINEFYIPALCIIHEHNFENIKIDINEVPFLKIKNEKSKYFKASLIEDNIINLWKKRKNKEIDYQSSLVFKDYLIASPEMIRLICNIIRKALKLKMSEDALPSVLIVGGAGSGKNNLINIIKIFSDFYCNGNTYYINMAGIKPDSEVACILMGSMDKTKNFPGIFSEIRKETFIKIKAIESQLNSTDKFNIYPTLILDEFNSLNIESQGILLRFIENSEIIKMGAIKDDFADKFKTLFDNNIDFQNIKKKYNNFLIIGIMNEDPDDLSREKAIEFIKKNEYISGLVGDLFYEQIMKIRRLRPDIKYRMIRSGKFEIPNLKDRKYDIPILFYVFIKSEIKHLLKEKELFITLNALDKLISPYFEWPGNIRQLQALSKIVCEFIPQEDFNSSTSDTIIIKEKYIDSAIQVMGLN